MGQMSQMPLLKLHPPDRASSSAQILHFMHGGQSIRAAHQFLRVIILVKSAMQGHPEAPCLWEKHADKILCSIGLHPTTHEPCLYSGLIANNRVLLL